MKNNVTASEYVCFVLKEAFSDRMAQHPMVPVKNVTRRDIDMFCDKAHELAEGVLTEQDVDALDTSTEHKTFIKYVAKVLKAFSDF